MVHRKSIKQINTAPGGIWAGGKIMKCKDCPYYWADPDNYSDIGYNPICHYPHNDGHAPCEIDDSERVTQAPAMKGGER